MDPLTIAVISDLHIGDHARSSDLCPEHHSSEGIDKDYRKRFKDFVKQNGIKADYLIIPGDITDSADPDQMSLASEVLIEFAKALHLPRKKIIFAPGNHDVDWSVLKNSKDRTNFRRNQRYATLRNPDWIFEKRMKKAEGNVLSPPHFSIYEYDNLLAVTYNSSWHDDPKISVHYGLIAADDLQRLSSSLNRFHYSSTQIRLFIVHHHPLQYSNPIPDEPDFSAMTNSENLLKVLRENDFDLLVHGHKHNPKFSTLSIDSGYPLVILAAGSFSSLLDSSWSGYVNNQFHLIRIIGRELNTRSIYGLIESWTYLSGTGWKPSETHNGIRHKIPFGTHVQPRILLEDLRNLIPKLLINESYVVWSKIADEKHYYRYLSPELILHLLEKLEESLGFRCHGDDPEDLILLRKE